MAAEAVGEGCLRVGVKRRCMQALLLGLKLAMLNVQSSLLSVQLGVDHRIQRFGVGHRLEEFPMLIIEKRVTASCTKAHTSLARLAHVQSRPASCAMRYSGREPDPVTVRVMTNCAYCGEYASVAIPAIPGQVCMTHALEFWTGLLTYVKDQAKRAEQHGTSCVCGMCNNAAAQHPVAPLFTATWRDLPIQ
jgi:hypothetical protein